MMLSLVCPHCHEQSKYNAPAEGWLEGACLKCEKPFRTLLATVRAKRSRGDKRMNSRHFDVRVKHNGREEMLAFSAGGYGDFELRSSDSAAFHFIENSLHVVQNFTINQYMVVRNASGGWMALVVLCVIGFALLWFFSR